MKKFNIKKGDTVFVNAGNDKGKSGKVLEVLRDKDRVVVEGINMVSKHTKPNPQQPQGGIVKKEAHPYFQRQPDGRRRQADENRPQGGRRKEGPYR